jgi:hypothetical protein
MKKTTKPAEKTIKLVTKPAAAPAAPKSDTALAPTKTKPANRRITPGAEIREWRVVPSLRESQPGYFLQGGHFKKTSRGNSFIVGEEVHFVELKKAKEALAAKNPKPASPTSVPPAPKPPSAPVKKKAASAPPSEAPSVPAPATR